MGEAWVGSSIPAHIQGLCDDIGVRWAGSDGDRRAAQYISEQFAAYGLENVGFEPFPLKTWRCDSVEISVAGEESWTIDARPVLFCPSVSVTAPLVDAGFGMAHEIERLNGGLRGAVAIMDTGFEPFSPAEAICDPCGRSCGRRRAGYPDSQSPRRTTHQSHVGQRLAGRLGERGRFADDSDLAGGWGEVAESRSARRHRNREGGRDRHKH